MKVKTIALVGIIALLFGGCAQPAFNQNKKHIIFVEGKSFRIPIASNWSRAFMHPEANKEKIKEYRKQGLTCKNGDLFWIEYYADKERVSLIDSGNKQKGYAFLGKSVRERKAGCAHPMSNQEYHFYREKELQDARDRKANGKAIQEAANAWADAHKPPTRVNVNVQHSGTVRHNVNVYNY